MTTLLLDQTAWDLVLDANNNVALAGYPYSVAQDVATACRTFLGDCYFDQTIGLPYPQMLGQLPPLAFVRAQLVNAALTVPTVVKATVLNLALNANRQLTGSIEVIDTQGLTIGAHF